MTPPLVAALTAQIGGPQVQAGQLRHLLAVMGLPSIALAIIPSRRERSARQWPVEMFFCFDNTQVSVELVSGFLNITDPREIAMYTSAFADLASLAVTGGKARELITAALERLE